MEQHTTLLDFYYPTRKILSCCLNYKVAQLLQTQNRASIVHLQIPSTHHTMSPAANYL